MIRRDILFFIGIIIYGLAIYFILPGYNTPQEIIVHMGIFTILLVVYLWGIIVLELISKKISDWNCKKLF